MGRELERHKAQCDRLLDTDPSIGHGSLQRLMWMRKRARARVYATWEPRAQNEAADDFHAFDAAIKAIQEKARD